MVDLGTFLLEKLRGFPVEVEITEQEYRWFETNGDYFMFSGLYLPMYEFTKYGITQFINYRLFKNYRTGGEGYVLQTEEYTRDTPSHFSIGNFVRDMIYIENHIWASRSFTPMIIKNLYDVMYGIRIQNKLYLMSTYKIDVNGEIMKILYDNFRIKSEAFMENMKRAGMIKILGKMEIFDTLMMEKDVDDVIFM